MAERNFDDVDIVNTSKNQNHNRDIKLDVFKYYLMPSLQHTSMTNVIISLWNQADIKYQIVKLFSEYEYKLHARTFYSLFSKITNKILNKLLQLPVPTRIRKTLSNIVHPIGWEICDWIEYNDKYIFNINSNCPDQKSISVNYINYLKWTSRGVIDYQETAKILLAEEDELSDIYKYSIACAYCLDDDIALIAPNVINTTLILESIWRQPMLYFWTAHITGDFTNLDEALSSYNEQNSTNYSINECIFKVLIDKQDINKNKTAIKFIWDKLNNEEKSRQVVPAIRLADNDIRCFLLSQISKEQKKEVFRTNCAAEILLPILRNCLWGQYFLPMIHDIWDILPGYDYLDLLESIVYDMKDDCQEDTDKYYHYKSVFKELWQCAPKHLKEYVIEYQDGDFFPTFFLKIFSKTNLDIIQLILADINDAQKKQIIFSKDGIRKCNIFVIRNQWDLLEGLIGSTLFSREDVDNFKQQFIKKIGEVTAVQLIQNKEWNKVEQFLQWALNLKSDEDMKKFKQNLLYSKIFEDTLKSVVANSKVDFTELEYFLKWCFSGDEEKLVKCKAEIPEIYFEKLICKLIKEDKYELLEKVLNWCFLNDSKQIAKFKQYFLRHDQIHKIKKLMHYLIEQADPLKSLKKFVKFWGSAEEEINML